MTEKHLKWSANEIVRFLDIYRNYEGLWDTNNINYMKKTERKHNFKWLINELIEAGFEIPGEKNLKKKIKNLKDAYRNEMNKVKKSVKSGAGADDVYKPKLVWFEKANAFWGNVISERESSSNLDLSAVTQSSTANVYYSSQTIGDENGTSGLLGPRTRNSSQGTSTASQAVPKPQANKRSLINIAAPEIPPKLLKVKTAKKTASRFEKAVSKLHEIAEMTNGDTEDQYGSFGNHVAAQLRELPLRSFIVLQEKIQSLITQERLATFETLHSSQHSPSPGI